MEVDVGASGKCLLSAFLCLLAASLAAPSVALLRPPSPFLGISPHDKWYYYQSAVIPCKDRSKSFPRERLNDDFCDCSDGTDEPGTSACPEGRFYCYSLSSKPQLLFSSRVNDHICDCCDGSDEYDGKVTCQNVCSAEVRAHENDEISDAKMHGSNVDGLKARNINNLKELFQKLKALKVLVVVEVIFGFFIICGFFRKRIKFKRRQLRRERNV